MQFIIESYVGAGEIKFGMSHSQIAEMLQTNPRKFKKFKDDECETDAFEICYVYYKKSGNYEAIEFFKPANVLFNGVNLLEESYEKIKNLFLGLDINTECDESGLTSLKYGIGVYAPFASEEPMNPPEGVIVFEEGYYN